MKGYFRRRGCTCKKKKCTCGAKWSFTIDIDPDPATGDRRQKTVSGFNTKEEAEDAATILYYELKNGIYVEESNKLFKDFAEEWLDIYQKTHKVKISSVRVRRHEINLLMPYFAHRKIKDITRKMYQEALNKLKDKNYSERTISGVHSTGRMIFKKAIEYDMIKKDPSQYARVPRSQKTVEELEQEVELPKYLEKEELALFLDTARERGIEIDYTVFLTLAYTGIRVGELCALKWKDIDHEAQTISIIRTYYNPGNNTTKYKLLTPKTQKSKRIIEVDKVVLDELEKHKAKQNVLKMRLRKIYKDDDFIFAKTAKHPGYPELIKTIENRMRRLLKLAKLNESLTPHSLRHTHTSLLAEAGVGLPEIMDRLGHTDDETTKRIYLHVTKPMKKEASHKFSELMRSTLTTVTSLPSN